MLVIAHHFVQNADFWTTAQRIMENSALPQNLILHSVFPSKDGETGTCVWEAKTTNDVQDYLDKTFGKYAENVTYEVDEAGGVGLPKKSMVVSSELAL